MQHKRTIPKIFHYAKELRHNQTPEEAKLWSYLRAHRLADVSFRRQHAIGNYIVDFSPKGTLCAPSKKLIVELDGSQHLESEEYDLERTLYLESKGYKVIRFFNSDINKDIEAVLREILLAVGMEQDK